jgi:hypothetical protein
VEATIRLVHDLWKRGALFFYLRLEIERAEMSSKRRGRGEGGGKAINSKELSTSLVSDNVDKNINHLAPDPTGCLLTFTNFLVLSAQPIM